MEEVRPINTLLKVVIDSLKEGHKDDFYNNGICGEIENLLDKGKIIINESILLNNVLIKNKHKAIEEFGAVDDLWWWRLMRKDSSSREIRIKFLESLLV